MAKRPDRDVPVNLSVRLSIEQYERLQADADELGIALSAAVRRALDLGELMEHVRDEYERTGRVPLDLLRLVPADPIRDDDA